MLGALRTVLRILFTDLLVLLTLFLFAIYDHLAIDTSVSRFFKVRVKRNRNFQPDH